MTRAGIAALVLALVSSCSSTPGPEARGPGVFVSPSLSARPSGVSVIPSERPRLRVSRSSSPSRATWYARRPITCDGRRVPHVSIWAAHRTLPCGTRVELRANGRSVVVAVWDRGPCERWRYKPTTRCVRHRADHEFDLSSLAFARLADLSDGIIFVRWRVVA